MSFRVALLMSSRILKWTSQGLPEEVNEILNHHDLGSCQNLSTNELGGWFLACQDVHGRALNREYPDFRKIIIQEDLSDNKQQSKQKLWTGSSRSFVPGYRNTTSRTRNWSCAATHMWVGILMGDSYGMVSMTQSLTS